MEQEKKQFFKNFGENFRCLRKGRGLTQEGTAEKSGLSLAYISEIERGVANPKLDTILRLSHAVDVSPMELFNFEARLIDTETARERMILALKNSPDSNINNLYFTLLNAFVK